MSKRAQPSVPTRCDSLDATRLYFECLSRFVDFQDHLVKYWNMTRDSVDMPSRPDGRGDVPVCMCILCSSWICFISCEYFMWRPRPEFTLLASCVSVLFCKDVASDGLGICSFPRCAVSCPNQKACELILLMCTGGQGQGLSEEEL